VALPLWVSSELEAVGVTFVDRAAASDDIWCDVAGSRPLLALVLHEDSVSTVLPSFPRDGRPCGLASTRRSWCQLQSCAGRVPKDPSVAGDAQSGARPVRRPSGCRRARFTSAAPEGAVLPEERPMSRWLSAAEAASSPTRGPAGGVPAPPVVLGLRAAPEGVARSVRLRADRAASSKLEATWSLGRASSTPRATPSRRPESPPKEVVSDPTGSLWWLSEENRARSLAGLLS
jgi:hypothetical protein